MPTTFTLADSGDEVSDLLAEVMRKYHPDLAAAGVRLGILLAYNPDGDAVKAHGYPALATMKPCNPRERATKGYDAELTIDEAVWRGLNRNHRVPVLDHELSHVALVPLTPKELAAARAYDSAAAWWKLDDRGRPKLKSVKGDWNAGDGFTAVVERHGRWAAEFLNLQGCWSRAERAAGESVESVPGAPAEGPAQAVA